MRLWVETLYQNTSAHADFLAFLAETEKNVQEMIYNELTNSGATGKAVGLAHELRVYRNIRNRFKRDTNEHIQNIQHSERST